ncbi:hypothetical protein M011DRAFT_455394 [Sporormia fimetaria CBS 119925]|uniref:Pinin/SDK/MemA protein domain-containing protein n=1 Tax=Sporormia fimetaria CBS 119925 TaxID=1340428 RepID=A0A6A6VNS4_9PLEO|nr:hypothetical protein M011DRAFT_455394 [Sporormia fimetaria CBS 119925]
MDGPIASAVVLPEAEEDAQNDPPPSPGALKRTQSEAEEQDPKRQRLDSTDAHVNGNRRPSAVPGRRERGRERRLFGAALGALSQNSATSGQRKRAEIEKRQRAQRELEEHEDDQRKQEREARRKIQRQKEQERFERESIKIRHFNLRHMAHFLRTNAQPSLYYKPWETTSDEEDRIQAQIAEAEETIREELGQQKPPGEVPEDQRRDADGDSHTHTEQPRGEENGTDAPKQPPVTNGDVNMHDSSPKNSEAANNPQPEPISHEDGFETAATESADLVTAAHETPTQDDASRDMDDNGEEVVEAAEDTVIY